MLMLMSNANANVANANVFRNYFSFDESRASEGSNPVVLNCKSLIANHYYYSSFL